MMVVSSPSFLLSEFSWFLSKQPHTGECDHHHSLLGFHPTSLLPFLVALSRPQGLGDQSQWLLFGRGPAWLPLGQDKGEEMRGWPLSPSLLAHRCQMSHGLMFGVASSSFVFFLLCWRDRSRCEKSNWSSHGCRRGKAESLDNDIFYLDITRHASRYCHLPGFCLCNRAELTHSL